MASESAKPLLVLVTASSPDEARHIARALLERKLAACVNLVPGVESHYWWKEKIENQSEVLLMIKTTGALFDAVEECVRANHSYECPEIVAFEPERVAGSYLAWWKGEVRHE